MADRTRRGVYRNLEISPYEYRTPYGDIFKFSSAKKLEIYARDIEKELIRIRKALDRLELHRFLPAEIISLIIRTAYKAFYEQVEG